MWGTPNTARGPSCSFGVAGDLGGRRIVRAEETVTEMLSELAPATGLGSESHGLASESHRPPWLDRILDVLHERYSDVVRVSDLAAEAGVHPVHVARSTLR